MELYSRSSLGMFVSLAIVVLGADNATAARGRHCRKRPMNCYPVHRCLECCAASCRQCYAASQAPEIVEVPKHISRVLARGSVRLPKTGETYAYTEVDDPGTEPELHEELARKLSPADRLAASNSEEFMGHDRRIAKTSIADASVENVGGLAAVLNSLPTDHAMLNHDPEITEHEDSDRGEEESRNVHFTAYLYATKKEDDNDYHLILGTTASPNHSRFMTAEVSGLPRTGPDRARLKVPRKAFQDEFADSPIGAQYRKFSNPIPVEVTGSLFFDVDHRAGVVGPEGLKPKTAWEVHPVTEIVFEP
jgi:hypothetical protein